MSHTLFIQAVNIHQGGGARLLNLVLGALKLDCRVVLNIDQRMILTADLPEQVQIRRVQNSILARLCAEFFLYKNSTHDDFILCFGNLPPILPVKAHTTVFVQNRYIIDYVSLVNHKFWERLRIQSERIWFRLSMYHADQFLVQTTSMKNLLDVIIRGRKPVTLAPLADVNITGEIKRVPESNQCALPKFIYVASGDCHKNHARLIDAWCLLAIDDIRPQLYLTIDKWQFPNLCALIAERKTKYNLNISNLGIVDACVMTEIYKKADVLIYPSLFESFGLPLLEAQSHGLEIIASELDYVRDVIQPAQTFNPKSALSIARAVKRLLGYSNPNLALFSPTEFLAAAMKEFK